MSEYENSAGPELIAALVKVHKKLETITKNKTAGTSGSYSYQYADLAAIMGTVRELLAAEGLVLAQLIDGDNLVTLLMHESGQQLPSVAPLGEPKDMQDYGKRVSYMRRYQATAILTLATSASEDDDAPKVPIGKRKPKAKQAPASKQAANNGEPSRRSSLGAALTKHAKAAHIDIDMRLDGAYMVFDAQMMAAAGFEGGRDMEVRLNDLSDDQMARVVTVFENDTAAAK